MPEIIYCQRNYGGDWLGTCTGTDRGLYGCYVTTLAMILTHYGWVIDPAQLDNDITRRGIYAEGCLLYPQALVAYQPAIGLEASLDYSSYPADLSQLSMDLEQECVVRVDGYWWGLGYPTHFLRAWSWDGSTAVLADPWTGELRSLSAGEAARAITGIDRYRLPGFRPDWAGGGEPEPPPTPEPPAVGTFQVTSRGSNIRTAPSTTEGAVVRVAAEGEVLTIDAGTHAEAVPDYGYADPGSHPDDIWWEVQGGGWVADGAVAGFPPAGWSNWVEWRPEPPAITEPPPPETDYGPPLMSSYIDPGATWHPAPAGNFTPDRRARIESGEVIGQSYNLADGPAWIVMHHMAGTLSATDAEFLRPSEKSAHYGIAQSGGKYQWVDEKDAAYHAGNYDANRASIGIEHEDAGADQYTWAEVEASAEVVANVCRRYSIPCERGDWASGRAGVVLHREIVATECPGALDVDGIITRAAAILAAPEVQPPPKHPAGSTDAETAAWLEEVAAWIKAHPS